MLVLSVAGHATAQAPPPPSPPAAQPAPAPQSAIVEELEVVARARGPAMWTVTRGDAQVIVVGSYSPLPHSLDWDEGRLDRALTGARALYVPRAALNPLELAGLLFTSGALKNPGGHSLDAVIGPQRAERLRAVALTAHADPKRMQPYKPAVAAILAYQTFIRTVGWSSEKPRTTVERAAHAQHTPVRALAKLGAASLVRRLETMDDPAQLACFDGVLDQIEWESAHGVAAARAWAEGRLEDLRRERSQAILDRCILDNTGPRGVIAKGVVDSAASIDEALRSGGKSVALVPIEFITARDGVLDRLKAAGAQITVPPG
jgi:hypothetical protein